MIADADRCMTVAYVMNKMRPVLVGPIAAALLERLYEIVSRQSRAATNGVRPHNARTMPRLATGRSAFTCVGPGVCQGSEVNAVADPGRLFLFVYRKEYTIDVSG